MGKESVRYDEKLLRFYKRKGVEDEDEMVGGVRGSLRRYRRGGSYQDSRYLLHRR